MPQILCVRLDWNHTAIPLRIASKFFRLEVNPEPQYPFGRKGLSLAGAWKQLAGPDIAGMLLLDGDVAIDPHDYDRMLKAIDTAPEVVHTAPVKLWPISTHLKNWVWGHGRNGRYSQDNPADDELDTFTFCYTYLPRKLIEACIDKGLSTWAYPGVDRNVCEVARSIGMPVRLVRDCRPKHLNY